MSAKLKPCPFCGESCIEGPRAEHIERAAGYGYTVFNVGHAQLSSTRQKCIAWVTAPSPEEAIDRWNRRGQQPDSERDAALPDMLWDASDPEVFANSADEFANDYAHGNLSPGDVSEVKVECAARLPNRSMRIELTDDENRSVKWEWIDAAMAAQHKQT